MKILFVSYPSRSHLIPLIAFYKRYLSQMKNVLCYFLISEADLEYCKKYNINVLKFDYTYYEKKNSSFVLKNIQHFLEKRNSIVKQFNPDVIIEDSSFETSEFCEVNSIPRISVQRTGFFRSSNPIHRNNMHVHSIEKAFINGRRYKVFEYKQYVAGQDADILDPNFYFPKYSANRDLFNVLNANAKVIPGIPLIEMLPSILNDNSYFYCGPLILEDTENSVILNSLSSFLEQNRKCLKVLLTTGLVEQQDLTEIFKILTNKGFAIITTVYPPYEVNKINIFYHPFLPLHFVTKNVNLVIHQCGSGIYHYPLLYEKPVITLGTQCYDREEIALRLQELKVSLHVPSRYDDPNYIDIFTSSVECFENNRLCDFDNLALIRNEIGLVSKKFSINDVLNIL